MKRILTAFYSLKGETYVNGETVWREVGNTEIIARKIQGIVGGDLFHIKNVASYPSDHMELIEVAKQELQRNARPELSAHVENMDQYDILFLGYPNWWGTMPMAVHTFLESYDFAGKTIIPFCTHEGSGMGRSVADIRRLCPGSTVPEGVAIRGGNVAQAEPEVEELIDSIHSTTMIVIEPKIE